MELQGLRMTSIARVIESKLMKITKEKEIWSIEKKDFQKKLEGKTDRIKEMDKSLQSKNLKILELEKEIS